MTGAAPPPRELVRTAAIIEYDGTGFVGLQWQKQGESIQSAVEAAAEKCSVPDCRFRASGRTDAGVHARGQVIALDLTPRIAHGNAVSALNWHLPESIRIRRAVPCDPGFDPRRHAIRRTYRYLLCGGQAMPALARNRMGKCKSRLDLAAMRAAAAEFTGTHDFAAWRSSQCQARRTVLDVELAEVVPWADAAPHGMDGQAFEITFACRSFLHRMVRFLVGGLCAVGSGRLRVEDLRAHLASGTLPPRVAPADACGLSLERVDYPPGHDPFATAASD